MKELIIDYAKLDANPLLKLKDICTFYVEHINIENQYDGLAHRGINQCGFMLSDDVKVKLRFRILDIFNSSRWRELESEIEEVQKIKLITPDGREKIYSTFICLECSKTFEWIDIVYLAEAK